MKKIVFPFVLLMFVQGCCLHPNVKPTLELTKKTLNELREDYEGSFIHRVKPSASVTKEEAEELNDVHSIGAMDLIDKATADIDEALKGWK